MLSWETSNPHKSLFVSKAIYCMQKEHLIITYTIVSVSLFSKKQSYLNSKCLLKYLGKKWFSQLLYNIWDGWFEDTKFLNSSSFLYWSSGSTGLSVRLQKVINIIYIHTLSYLDFPLFIIYFYDHWTSSVLYISLCLLFLSFFQCSVSRIFCVWFQTASQLLDFIVLVTNINLLWHVSGSYGTSYFLYYTQQGYKG